MTEQLKNGPEGSSGLLYNYEENHLPKPLEPNSKEARWEKLESATISPRARVEKREELVKNDEKEYRLGDGIELPLARFLIKGEIEINNIDGDNPIFDPENNVFQRAFEYLKDAKSAETFVEKSSIKDIGLSRSFSNRLNVVLVDIFEFKHIQQEKKSDGEQEKVAPNAVHTICIWKRADNELLLIDPNNDENLSRFANLSCPNVRTVSIKKNIDSKFYKPFDSTKAKEGYKNQNGYECNKDSRDCIDIAVKIASSLIWSQLSALTVFSVEDRLNYLSNQKKVNKLIKTDNQARIGWLQSWSPIERDEVTRLFMEHQNYLQLVDICEFKDLEQFVKARFNPDFKPFFTGELDKNIMKGVSSIPSKSLNDFLVRYCEIKDLMKKSSELQKQANKMTEKLQKF